MTINIANKFNGYDHKIFSLFFFFLFPLLVGQEIYDTLVNKEESRLS